MTTSFSACSLIMHSVDGSFKKKREMLLLARKRQTLWRRVVTIIVALVLVPATVGLGVWFYRTTDGGHLVGPDADQVAEVIVPSFAPTIIDLPGDPIRIELGAGGGASNLRLLTLPPALASLGVSGQVTMISEKIIESGQRLVTAIPSSQQDFAFFQSQRNTAAQPVKSDTTSPQAPVGGNTEVPEPSPGIAPDDDQTGQGTDLQSDGWGDAGEDAGDDPGFKPTDIENNVSSISLIREINRSPSFEDVFVHVVSSVELSQFLGENGINALDARRAGDALKSGFGRQTVEQGSIVAMRQLKVSGNGKDRKLVQFALYLPDTFLAALALSDTGNYQTAADPWSDRDLFEHADDAKEKTTSQFRLLDGVYSAGVRGGVPPSIVGEAIMYLSRNYDLSDLAGGEDRVTLIYTNQPRDGGQSPGRIIYASIEQPKRHIRCFVYRPQGANDFSCQDEFDQSGTIETINDMVTPVSGGVMTSQFGWRNHPILKKPKLHSGVDWAAPIGTEVRVAFAGSISYAGDGGGYGNVLKVSHPDGRETRYAHLSAFANGAKPGKAVAAGDVIGFVGTTGLSTGPHLHFELYVNGVAVDPLAAETLKRSAETDSVAIVVNKIIRVESGGNASAKNPLSSAAGLGQFIDSTWLKVMQNHRPDLASSLSRDQQLALRYDPTLATELLTYFTRDNKAYLDSLNLPVSAGNLYLVHFLGPGGARLVLESGDGQDLEALLGSSVISANGFLRGQNVAWIKNWSARKMGSQSYVALAPVVKTKTFEQASPDYALYRKTVLELVGES
jgi:murein DD-endopeptidase MepM/ murein hydrolase activator NlpD